MFCNQICEQIKTMLIAKTFWPFAWGLFIGWIVAFLCGWFIVKKWIVRLQENLESNIKDSQKNNPTWLKEKWLKFVQMDKKLTKPNRWLGVCEITFFYICLLISRPEGIGVWLAFKVAGKWDSWVNIIKLPAEIKYKRKKSDEFEYLQLRNDVATSTLQRFFIGTIMNILIAFLGIGVFCVVRTCLTNEMIQNIMNFCEFLIKYGLSQLEESTKRFLVSVQKFKLYIH